MKRADVSARYRFFCVAIALWSATMFFSAMIVAQSVVAEARGRGYPWISLSDAQEVLSEFEGDAQLAMAAEFSDFEPLTLAAADFNEDGIPDLVCGYASPDGGALILHLGTLRADHAFQRGVRIYGLPVEPQFLETGDFDGDGLQDVVLARFDSHRFWFLAGRNKVGFDTPQPIELPGPITAIESGDFGNRDGLDDLLLLTPGSAPLRILTRAGRRFEVDSSSRDSNPVRSFELEARGQVAAVLPLRLTKHALDALVVLLDGDPVLSVLRPVPVNIFTVNDAGTDFDGNAGDGVCAAAPCEGGVCSGPCTLRAAINEANESPGHDEIRFSVASIERPDGEFGINFITESLTLDGCGGSPGSNVGCEPGAGRTELRELQIGLNASDTVIQGLVMNNERGLQGGLATQFRLILLDEGVQNCHIVANYLGTDITGKVSQGGAGSAIQIHDSSNNTIGGANERLRNVIAGSRSHGIVIRGTSAQNKILGNYIGTDASGMEAVPNGTRSFDAGIRFEGSGTGHSISQNSIFENGFLGIDLSPGGVTPNDTVEGDEDVDSGPNNLQNFRHLTGAGNGRINWTFSSRTAQNGGVKTYRLEFFGNTSCDTSTDESGTAFGEGESFLTSDDIPLPEATVSGTTFVDIPPRIQAITATATELIDGKPASTSEFSNCIPVQVREAFIVNSTRDLEDNNPGDGICATGENGFPDQVGFGSCPLEPECTLRAAIMESNALPGADKVQFEIPVCDHGHAGVGQSRFPIRPDGRALEPITEPLTIEGNTQLVSPPP